MNSIRTVLLGQKQKCKPILTLPHCFFSPYVFRGCTDLKTVWLETTDFFIMSFLNQFLKSSGHLAATAFCSRAFQGLNVFWLEDYFLCLCFLVAVPCPSLMFLKYCVTPAVLVLWYRGRLKREVICCSYSFFSCSVSLDCCVGNHVVVAICYCSFVL